MSSLLDNVKALIEKNVGDVARLEHIKKTIENNKQLYTSDREFLDYLIKKHLSNNQKPDESRTLPTTEEVPKTSTSINTDYENKSQNRFCGNCGKSIEIESDFCPKCGSSLKGHSKPSQNKLQRPTEWKSESTTLLLSIILGLFGIQGVGHLYVGKIFKGIVILIGSVVLLTVAMILIFTGIGAIIGAPLLIIYFVMFIWQIIDSRNLCREYNQYLEQHERPPEW